MTARIKGKILLPLLLLFLSFNLMSQDRAIARIYRGVDLYSQGRWHEAVLELRRAQAEAANQEQRGEALYWISLSLLSAGEYEQALRDMAIFEQITPNSFRIAEINYHRGRAYYFLDRYEDAIFSLIQYADSFNINPSGYMSRDDSSRRAAALYWIGECLLAMGQLDRAQDVFRYVTVEYPWSSKFEASIYRIAIIDHRKTEAELLALLRWSYEGSFRLNELENENSFFREQLFIAEERIRYLENIIRESTLIIEGHRLPSEIPGLP